MVRSAGEALPDRDKTGTKVRQNRDKSATKNTALPLSQRGKTVAKVGQESEVARCHGVPKP